MSTIPTFALQAVASSSSTDILHTLQTAPWCSRRLLDAVEAAIDTGMIDEVDRIFDAREQAEAVKYGSL
jgi:hypothetical protein